ncbi:MAG: Asparagine synthetase [glutamine-hydrolyzing] 1 [Haliscomenobacter sp.]|nr:Asparagine synthetase [glutamine-hydrolyzing] 1 [Haliscomenobacter sp.]
MCGILGYFNKNAILDSKHFEGSLNKIIHRGPDGYGVFYDKYLCLGHRRLSIIDLTENAKQPFFSSSGKSCIIFNGEIYNYQALKENLETRTLSDTEVLLEGFLKGGTDFLKKIRGIYAFCIYDFQDIPKLYLFRDPSGIKPLYYYSKDEEFVFASEIKSILPLLKQKPEINEPILKKYIHLGYCPEPETIYKEINTLLPGYLMVFDLDSGEITYKEVNSYRFGFKNNLSFNNNKKNTYDLFEQACGRNLVADVDMSVALSGGIDSSLVYAISNKDRDVQGITIRFSEKDYDEGGIAEEYARFINASHITADVEVDGKLELLNKLLLHFDQPYADSSFIPFFFLCQKASEHCKVLIGGDGGDEIQNGYAGYKFLPFIYQLSQSRLKHLLNKSIKTVAATFPTSFQRQVKKLCSLIESNTLNELVFKWESWFPPDPALYPINPFKYDSASIAVINETATESEKSHIEIERIYFTGRMLGDYLKKSDMMSMINSIEFRVPMLDEDLVRYSLSIPFRQKSTLYSEKKILRAIHAKIFPRKYSKLKKRGFSIPLDTWLGHANLIQIRNILTAHNTFISKFIEPKYIAILFDSLEMNDERFTSRASVYQRILILYSLELWYEHYRDL